MKAGILLYALVLSLIFGLFLQFYLQNQVSTHKHLRLQKDRLLAELMVDVVMENQPKTDKIQFSAGTVIVQSLTNLSATKNTTDSSVSSQNQVFTVQLNDGTSFQIKKSLK
jgi:RNase P/RNase MRP subunit p29